MMKSKQNLRFIIYITVMLVYGPLNLANMAQGKRRETDIKIDEMVAREGFPFETHSITTDDGYILNVHRIPGSPGSTPVFLQHGLLESSAIYLFNGKNGSLALLLHQMGYDVWIGNARGNTYSKKHKTLSINDRKFWDFGWDELGLYDNPAAISYIVNKTNEKLFYVGHSMGCTSFAVMAIAKPDIAKNIKAMFALAPAVYATHNTQPLFNLASLIWKELLFFSDLLGVRGLFDRNAAFDFIADYLCPKVFVQSLFCDNVLFFFGGFDRPELPKDFTPTFYSKIPAGTSAKVFIQYFQQIRLAKLRHFNYLSAKKNMEVYGSQEPPEYDVSKIQVPVAVFYSHNDLLVGSKDAERFYEQVPNKLGLYAVEPYSHFDFLIGKQAPQRVYSTVFKLMSQFE